MSAPRILAMAGSTREGSLNKKLLRLAAAAARGAGADVTVVDLRDLPLPLYDGDLEEREGVPENARRLKALMIAHPGFLVSTPEYNSSIPGVFKNAIDWASREEPGEAPLACFKGKVVGLTSASPGRWGGIRALAHVREILQNIGALVLPDTLSLPRAHEAFDAEGKLKDAKVAAALENVARKLVRAVTALSGA